MNKKEKNKATIELGYGLDTDFCQSIKIYNSLKANRNLQINLKYGDFKTTLKYGDFKINLKYRGLKMFGYKLFYLIGLTKVPCIDRNTKKKVTIQGAIFMSDYKDGYHKGIEFYDDLYNDPYIKGNIDLFLSELKKGYFTKWLPKAEAFPFIWTKKVFYDIGYCSGIVSKIHEFVENRPELSKRIFLDEKHVKTNDPKNLNPRQLGMAIAILEMNNKLPKEILFENNEELYKNSSIHFYGNDKKSGKIKGGYKHFKSYHKPLDGPQLKHRKELEKYFADDQEALKVISNRK